MKKKEFLIIFFLLIIASFFACFSLLQKIETPTADTVEINKLVKLTEQNWDKFDEKIYPASDLKFSVIDIDGKVLYSTGTIVASSYDEYINSAIKNYKIIIDINVRGQMVGKLIIDNNTGTMLGRERLKFQKNIVFSFILVSILMLGYLFFLDRKLIRPFHNLEKFAASVATGNLDEPIKMDRTNLFGAYTESFDLMRDALRTSRQNEYLANKSKKELVASLSHDIKNPVASIKATCETMALDLEDDRILTILQKAEQIDVLISDMFQSTLDELGELKVHNEEYNSEILLNIIEGINYYGKIRIITDIPECLISCDRLRLTQIMDNLAGNSYKYAGTEMHISFEVRDNFFLIRIKDFGSGVPEEELPMVCEKFYRGKNAKGKDGSGLGLYLSKLFIEKMGGQLECINEADGFAVIIVLRLVGTTHL